MRNPQLKGLSPAIKELVDPLVTWPNIQARWRGEFDTVSRIRSISESGEAHARLPRKRLPTPGLIRRYTRRI